MKLEHLRIFVAVAESGGLPSAAERVGRTPAALSLTLKQIESNLGGALFEGERKGRLTPLGEHVLEQAQRALVEVDIALANIRRYACGESGSVSVAAVPSAALRLIPVAVKKARALHPNLRIELRDIDSASVLDAVSSGVADFGIATPGNVTTGLAAERLLEDAFVLVCKPSHSLAKVGRPVRWEDIDPAEFITNGLVARIEAMQVRTLEAQASLNVVNTTSLLGFVEQGLGVTVLPTMALPPAGKLISVQLADRTATRKLDLITRAGATLSPAAVAMIRAVLEARDEFVLSRLESSADKTLRSPRKRSR